MSYPPPPGQNPQNPYGQNPYGGQQQPGYGYPQQGGAGYGYPQQGMQPGGHYPGAPGPVAARMPGQVLTARILLFVAGGIWAFLTVIALFGLFGAAALMREVNGDGAGVSEGAAMGFVVVFLILFGGMSALHIIPAAKFGNGAGGTRVMAIIAAGINTLFALLGLLGSFAQMSQPDGNAASPFAGVLWLVVSVLTLVFCSMRPASEWFNRPRY
ncbi:hypothetical protein [Streptomyces sp. ODS28]|uniref:hypothetical protein n=1 Tax=Streptomyces sp. ODS28 TaxID=3136688 RepID=UPI0031EE0DD2